MGVFSSDIFGLLGWAGFDTAVAVCVSEGQDYPRHLIRSLPRQVFVDSEGARWPIYVHTELPDYQVLWRDEGDIAILVDKSLTTPKQEVFKLETYEGYRDFERRLQELGR